METLIVPDCLEACSTCFAPRPAPDGPPPSIPQSGGPRGGIVARAVVGVKEISELLLGRPTHGHDRLMSRSEPVPQSDRPLPRPLQGPYLDRARLVAVDQGVGIESLSLAAQVSVQAFHESRGGGYPLSERREMLKRSASLSPRPSSFQIWGATGTYSRFIPPRPFSACGAVPQHDLRRTGTIVTPCSMGGLPTGCSGLRVTHAEPASRLTNLVLLETNNFWPP